MKRLLRMVPLQLFISSDYHKSVEVRVLIDSKALLSIIGSELDFLEDPLSARFVFNNPNVKEICGCGLSFKA